jgi:hypothetical protein
MLRNAIVGRWRASRGMGRNGSCRAHSQPNSRPQKALSSALIALLPLIASGCGLQGGLQLAGSQTPGALAEIEQLKTAVVTAPLAGCVSIVQQAAGQLNALATGQPAIPVQPVPISPTPAPPVLVAPSPTPAPPTPPVVVTPPGVPTSPPANLP